jgi:glycogen debranching enzyme
MVAPRVRRHAAEPFHDHGEAPEYNTVDAALWHVVAVHEFLEAAGAR